VGSGGMVKPGTFEIEVNSGSSTNLEEPTQRIRELSK
jgi:hypothetical protein